MHKFGECNQAKKFFRADHFRQHLKHSHAGASGKWTNMLEMACMKDEPPPVPIMQQAQAQSQSQRPQAQAQAQAQTRTAQQQQQERIAGGAMGVLLPPTGQQQQQQGTAIPDVINEVHNES
ncbi:MAG: hypothetical protein INR71_00545 [Terriglobus roseus]|nr:hypothetical protein [Terriglobus roseus]